MTYRTDNGGIAIRAPIKLQSNGSSWGTRLSQLARQKGAVRIITYSLPRMEYVQEQLGRRPENIQLVAHEKFRGRAAEIARTYPEISVRIVDDVHSKVLLVAPGSVTVSSANFGRSGWHETSVTFTSEAAHDWYVRQVFEPLWARAVTP